MQEDKIYDKLLETIVDKSYYEKDEISPRHRLRSDLAFDSLDMVELTLEIEKQYNISIPDKDLGDKFPGDPTVEEVYRYILSKLNS